MHGGEAHSRAKQDESEVKNGPPAHGISPQRRFLIAASLQARAAAVQYNA
jgi:hypothetical protein